MFTYVVVLYCVTLCHCDISHKFNTDVCLNVFNSIVDVS